MPRYLDIEPPNGEILQYPWDTRIQHRFNLSDADITSLERGEVVWQGDNALSLGEDKYGE